MDKEGVAAHGMAKSGTVENDSEKFAGNATVPVSDRVHVRFREMAPYQLSGMFPPFGHDPHVAINSQNDKYIIKNLSAQVLTERSSSYVLTTGSHRFPGLMKRGNSVVRLFQIRVPHQDCHRCYSFLGNLLSS